jgi:hypothetical protein
MFFCLRRERGARNRRPCTALTATTPVSTGRQADRKQLRRGGPWIKPNRHRPPGDARRQVAGLALWRAVAAAPAVLGSLLLLMLVSVALGRWAALLLLAWAAGAAVLMTRVAGPIPDDPVAINLWFREATIARPLGRGHRSPAPKGRHR